MNVPQLVNLTKARNHCYHGVTVFPAFSVEDDVKVETTHCYWYRITIETKSEGEVFFQ